MHHHPKLLARTKIVKATELPKHMPENLVVLRCLSPERQPLPSGMRTVVSQIAPLRLKSVDGTGGRHKYISTTCMCSLPAAYGPACPPPPLSKKSRIKSMITT